MAAYLLDTNVISCILSRRAGADKINLRIQSVLGQNATILISPIVFYEIKRGLYHKKTQKHLRFFEQLVSNFEWCDLKKTTWDASAKLWAECRKGGKVTGGGIDKDVLIAAQAQEHNAVVVTDNVRHFQYLGVNYVSW